MSDVCYLYDGLDDGHGLPGAGRAEHDVGRARRPRRDARHGRALLRVPADQLVPEPAGTLHESAVATHFFTPLTL